MNRSADDCGQAVDIRVASVDDAAAVHRCLRAAFEPYIDAYTPEAFSDTVLTADAARRRIETMTVWIAEAGGRVLGTLAAEVVTGEGHLRGMAVMPACLGTGVATRLLQTAEAGLAERGCVRITLDTTAPLARAIRFYTRNGYTPSGRVTDFFGMPLFEYEKTLRRHSPGVTPKAPLNRLCRWL